MVADADTARVARLFERMGAGKQQAEVMASQLMKRARQIARERGVSEVQAAGDLLAKVVEARDTGSAPSSSGTEAGGVQGS